MKLFGLRSFAFATVLAFLAAGCFLALQSLSAYFEDQRIENRNVVSALTAAPLNPKLPNVLIIGDSISISYTYPLRLRLEGLANVLRPLENCGNTSMILAGLDRWLGQTQWAVIHFNSGLHDLKHVQVENAPFEKAVWAGAGEGTPWISIETYRANLEKIVTHLKATGASLIFATTTPVPSGERNRVPADVALYNEAALSVMRKEGVGIDDLYTAARDSADRFQKRRDVHFHPAGSDILADHAAASIKAALSAHPSR